MLCMVDFDVIFSMDWLAPYYVVLDCYAKTVTLGLQSVPRIAWKRMFHSSPKIVISFLQASRLVERGCLFYLDHICDTSITSPSSLDYIHIVCEFI